MQTAIDARLALLEALRRELVGPDPQGAELDCTVPVRFPAPNVGQRGKSGGSEDTPEAYRPYREAGTGEEILSHRYRPLRRYGVGVLYPLQTGDQVIESGDSEGLESVAEASEQVRADRQEAVAERVAEISGRLRKARASQDSDDFDVSLANGFQPSSMGLSFLADLAPGSLLLVSSRGGRYVPLKVQIGEEDFVWRKRVTWEIEAEFAACGLPDTSARSRWQPKSSSSSNMEDLSGGIEVFVRPNPTHGPGHLITAILVNRHVGGARAVDEKAFFQCELNVAVSGGGEILPYPTLHGGKHAHADDEDAGLELLYRDRLTYAVGHGCAANWRQDATTGDISLCADVLPSFETPSITAGAGDGSDGIPISSLADLSDGIGLRRLTELADSYQTWISECRREAEGLADRLADAAGRHLDACDEALVRMRSGLALLDSDSIARRAFELANAAILLQQAAGLNQLRAAVSDRTHRYLSFTAPYAAPNPGALEAEGRGRWFPFQAAFLLLALPSVHNADDEYRDCVDLIWFPTGGGKTEAYLGVAAYHLFLRRMRRPDDAGTGVIMRYTLRLLTTDQFQRASRLLCAMESIRRRVPGELGGSPFSIGLWVGGSSTPNRRADAKKELSNLKSPKKGTRNSFVVDSCPWCGAEMGPTRARLPKNLGAALGYHWDAELSTVVFRCADSHCDFHSGLPICVIDEDLYKSPPSLLIGTVDKFARLSWTGETRSLFGIGPDGSRYASPPGLIIQDELHLISGPLGSMVGLYETTIERLCTEDDHKPKIICSTATIRRYEKQVEALYGRTASAVFPPPGLSADDSFFARTAVGEDGKYLPGRLYVGVHAPGLQSMQTAQVRTISALLQGAQDLPEHLRDPWWTPLVFFNSLRELGTTLSLVQSDIPDYLDAIRSRRAIPWADLRTLENPIELTGRITSEDVPKALAALRQEYSPKKSAAVDLCLASNMVEVGVDVPRLSLMVVVGQPKSTSAYIQASGRIGRNWRKKPGLVVTIYGASKPRDRSHFEKFRTYHERLYAQVEPLSVTPMSDPALERALHAVMLSYVRQVSPDGVAGSPRPYSDWDALLNGFEQMIATRAEVVAPHQLPVITRLLAARRDEWRRWNRAEWGKPFNHSEEVPLMVSAGSHTPPLWRDVVWQVPTSLRNVDQECEIDVPIQDLSLGNDADV